jgi:beta-glucanase (GH16 family)
MLPLHKAVVGGSVLLVSVVAPPSVAHGGRPHMATNSGPRLSAVMPEGKVCRLKLIDNFKGGTAAFDIQHNVSLHTQTVRRGSSLAIPGQKGSQRILTVTPLQSTDGASVARQFSSEQNWAHASNLKLWFHGTRSGSKVTVQVLGSQGPIPPTSSAPLVWSDEFNGAAGTPPNPSIWNHEVGDGSANGNTGWGNNELEYYTDSTDNAALDGQGNLQIVARKAPSSLTCYYGPCQYTSARLTTQNKMQFMYGRIEARIRIPQGAGMWPAFWGLGTNIGRVGWPTSGEIDIMENVGRQPGLLYATIHGPGYSGANGFGGTYQASGDLSSVFHVYAIDWRPGHVDWLIDGVKYFSAAAKNVAPNQWVYDHPFFLLLNVAVGGNFGQAVGPDTVFPQSMLVDYVRVYGVTDTSERYESSFSDNFSGWKLITLRLKSFARSADQPDGAPNQGLQLAHISGFGLKLPAGITQPAVLGGLSLETCSR